MIEFVFLDLDDTILDFRKAEAEAVSRTIRQFGGEPTGEVVSRYHIINRWHWQQLELGKLTREQVLVNRFAVLFRELGLTVDPEQCARSYERNLSRGHDLLPGALEALEELGKTYRLFLASNGTATVQHSRLTDAGLYRYFEQVFISQEVGYNKPAREFFEACFARIPGFARERAVMVGDSLTSDIQGGINAGISTVWVNPQGEPWIGIRPAYEIRNLSQLKGLLADMNMTGGVGNGGI